MSCASPEKMPARCSCSAAATGANADFCGDISNGLHAIAQPLTILRGALGVLTAPERSGRDHRRYLEMSISQVERLCDLLSHMQSYVDTHHFPANLAPLDVDTVINSVIEEMEPVLLEKELELAVVKPEGRLAILADEERTREAVRSVLKIQASISSSGDAIRILTSPREKLIELVVENENSHGKTFGSSERLSLALAEANIRTQDGAFRWTENPVRISMELPAQNIKRNEDRAEREVRSIAQYPQISC